MDYSARGTSIIVAGGCTSDVGALCTGNPPLPHLPVMTDMSVGKTSVAFQQYPYSKKDYGGKDKRN